MKTPWLCFFYVVASAPGASALDVDVPDWAMPQITIATHDLWIEIADADAVLLRMAVPGFMTDEGNGAFRFDLGGRFKLDEFAGANYPHIRYRWIELCSVEVATTEAGAALVAAYGSRLLEVRCGVTGAVMPSAPEAAQRRNAHAADLLRKPTIKALRADRF